MKYKNPGPINFIAEAERNSDVANSSSWIIFPFSVEELFGVKGRVPVKVWFEDIAYRGSLVKMGSENHRVLILKEIRQQLDDRGIKDIHVKIELDTEERKIELPKDVLKSLSKNVKAMELWNKLAYSHQREFYKWIDEAKRAETRETRVKKMIEMLLEKKNRN